MELKLTSQLTKFYFRVKIHEALKNSFQKYQNGKCEVCSPISDEDKKRLKQNVRKLQIYESAYRFCDDHFKIYISSNNNETIDNENL